MKHNQLRFYTMLLLTMTFSIPYAIAKGGQCDYVEYNVDHRGDNPTNRTGILSWHTYTNQYGNEVLLFEDKPSGSTTPSFIKDMVDIKKNNGNNDGGLTIQETMSAERTYNVAGPYLFSKDTEHQITSLEYKGQYEMKMMIPGDLTSDLTSFKFVLNHNADYPSSYTYDITIDWETNTGLAHESVNISRNEEILPVAKSSTITKRLVLNNCKSRT